MGVGMGVGRDMGRGEVVGGEDGSWRGERDRRGEVGYWIG